MSPNERIADRSTGDLTATDATAPFASERRAILVAGMHRSGTSALTRTLSLVGGSLATDLMPPVPGNNERGFWESQAVADLHDEALHSAGSAWDDVTRFPSDWFASDVAAAFGRRLLELLQSEFADAPLFAVKDPRICRLIPLWLDVLTRFDSRTQFVIPLRNPVEVAASLQARDGFPLAKGYLLWLRNSLDAERATRGQQRVFVTYDALLDDWRGVLERISNALSIFWPRLSRAAEAEIEGFLSGGLRHQRADWQESRRRRSLPEWVVTAYDALLQLAEGNDTACGALDAVLADIDRADDTYGLALAALDGQLQDSQRASQEASARHERDFAELQHRFAALHSDAENLNEQLILERETVSRLEEQLRQAAAKRKDALARQRALDRQRKALRKDYERRIAEIHASSSWRITAPFRALILALRKPRNRTSAAAGFLQVKVDGADRPARTASTGGHAEASRRHASDDSSAATDQSAAAKSIAASIAGRVPVWNGDPVASLPPAAHPERVLIIDWKVPTPDLDSGSVRMSRIIDCLLRAGIPLDFASDHGADAKTPDALQKRGIRVLAGREAILAHMLQHGMSYRRVLLSRPEVAHDYLPIVRACAVKAEVIYDTVDLHWVRFARGGDVLDQAGELTERAERYRRIELANACSADLTLAITDEERIALLAEAPEVDVRVLPNIHEMPPAGPPFTARFDLLFVGGFMHEPNVDAVRYFVAQILPRIVTGLNGVRLRIVGSGMPRALRDLASKHVEAVGYVPAVEPYLESARVFVAPLRYGAGMKGKIGQSLSHGLPVVTTSVGAEGFGLVDGRDALICDDPKSFARQVIRAYTDQALWTRLADNGRRLIAERFSVAAVGPQVLSLLGGDPE